MDKSRLKIGKPYLCKRSTVIDDVQRTAERWMKCKEITAEGAIFGRNFEPDIELTNEQIGRELFEEK